MSSPDTCWHDWARVGTVGEFEHIKCSECGTHALVSPDIVRVLAMNYKPDILKYGPVKVDGLNVLQVWIK